MGRLYCHHCQRFYFAPLASVVGGCMFCRRSLESFEPYHVLRGRPCPGPCGADLVVTFEPATGDPGQPLCPICFTRWRVPVLVRDGVIYEPVVRLDRDPLPH